MIQPTLLFGTFFALLGAGIYAYIGWLLGRRSVAASESRLAWVLFVVWWYALAGTNLAAGVLDLLGAFGVTDLALFLTFTQIDVLATCLALFGLVYYLLYLFTGSRRVLAPVMVFYICYYILLVYYYNWCTPSGVTVGRWSVGLVYERPQAGPFFLVMLSLLLLPQIVGSMAYFSLFYRVKDVTQKYRVALVSWSIIVAFLSSLLASIAGVAEADWWQVASRLIGLAATLLILSAYQPAKWIKTRWGISSVVDENV